MRRGTPVILGAPLNLHEVFQHPKKLGLCPNPICLKRFRHNKHRIIVLTKIWSLAYFPALHKTLTWIRCLMVPKGIECFRAHSMTLTLLSQD